MAEIYGKTPGTTDQRTKWTGIAIAVAILLAVLIVIAIMRG
jgi:hypothetical protein